jgi:ChrR-like protein with cupin domain
VADPTLPRFVREAFDLDTGDVDSAELDSAELDPSLTSADVERSLLSLERALADVNPAPGPAELTLPAFERLEQAISQPPYRYAPFFSRAAELFDLPEEALVAQIAQLQRPGAWRFAGLPGIAQVSVDAGPSVESAETLFVRFNPGVHFPGHEHTGVERVLVLEGSYTDSNGLVHRPGELREWAAGTAHSFEIDRGGPCIIASVVYGRRFDSWALRALAKLLGR